MPELDAELAFEGLDERLRRRRPSEEDHLERGWPLPSRVPPELEKRQEDRRHARTERHALAREELGDALGVHARAGHHELGSRRGRRVRNAPPARVEHRDDRKNRGGASETKDVGLGNAERVEDRRAVRVERPFGMASRSGRVAQRRGRVLIDCRPHVHPVVFGDEVLIRHGVRQRRIRHVRGICENHVRLDGGQLRGDGFGEWDEGEVQEEDSVLRVVHDVDELGRVEAGIERVTDRAHARNAEVDLEVAVRIPCQSGEPIADLDPARCERAGELLRPLPHVAPRVTVDRAFHRTRHDVLVRVDSSRMLDQGRDEQGPLHHPAAHRRLLGIGSVDGRVRGRRGRLQAAFASARGVPHFGAPTPALKGG